MACATAIHSRQRSRLEHRKSQVAGQLCYISPPEYPTPPSVPYNVEGCVCMRTCMHVILAVEQEYKFLKIYIQERRIHVNPLILAKTHPLPLSHHSYHHKESLSRLNKGITEGRGSLWP